MILAPKHLQMIFVGALVLVEPPHFSSACCMDAWACVCMCDLTAWAVIELRGMLVVGQNAVNVYV